MTDLETLLDALEPFVDVADWADRNGHDLAADFDMLLRGPGNAIAGHLQVQSDDFIRLRNLFREFRPTDRVG